MRQKRAPPPPLPPLLPLPPFQSSEIICQCHSTGEWHNCNFILIFWFLLFSLSMSLCCLGSFEWCQIKTKQGSSNNNTDLEMGTTTGDQLGDVLCLRVNLAHFSAAGRVLYSSPGSGDARCSLGITGWLMQQGGLCACRKTTRRPDGFQKPDPLPLANCTRPRAHGHSECSHESPRPEQTAEKVGWQVSLSQEGLAGQWLWVLRTKYSCPHLCFRRLSKPGQCYNERHRTDRQEDSSTLAQDLLWRSGPGVQQESWSPWPLTD
jgi:hypothetical protein